jgi:hypothetical protein
MTTSDTKNIFDTIFANNEIKEIFDPNNNTMTKYYINTGCTTEESYILSFLVTMEIWSNII